MTEDKGKSNVEKELRVHLYSTPRETLPLQAFENLKRSVKSGKLEQILTVDCISSVLCIDVPEDRILSSTIRLQPSLGARCLLMALQMSSNSSLSPPMGTIGLESEISPRSFRAPYSNE
jgi:hypothetical protein